MSRSFAQPAWFALGCVIQLFQLLSPTGAPAQPIPPRPSAPISVPTPTLAPPSAADKPILGEAKSLPVSVRTLLDRERLSQMSLSELRGLLAELAADLRVELAALDSGPGWITYLDLDDLVRFATAKNAALSAESRRALAEHAETFAKVLANSDYRTIWERYTFKMTLLALEELGRDVTGRTRRQLSEDLATFDKALDQISTGADWKTYLDLALLREALGRSGELSTVEQQKLHVGAQRFVAIQTDSRFSIVASLPGFQRASQGVRDLSSAYLDSEKNDVVPAVTQSDK